MPSLHTLKNGLKVILVPQPNTQSLTLTVFARVGSRYETKKINGVSHFIEHLMFKGTKRRPEARMISQELDRYGAEFNAFTGKELTSYYIKIDASKALTALDLLSDMLFHSRFDSKEMDRERGVILEEINMYEDNPRMHIDDLLEETMFAGHPLGWNIAGPKDVIRSISREELVAFHDHHYHPENLVVVMAGALPKAALKHCETYFGKAPVSKEKSAQPLPFAASKKPKRQIGYQLKKTEQVQLAIAFHGLPHTHPLQPAAGLLGAILGGSMSSRLFTEVREKRGLCYSISAGHETLQDTGLFTIFCGLEKAKAKKAVDVIWHELKKIAKTGVTKQELREAKDHIRGKLLLALEDSSNQADWYGRHWISRHRLISPQERMRQIERVQAKEIKKLAQAWFKPNQATCAAIGPFDGKSEIDYLFPTR